MVRIIMRLFGAALLFSIALGDITQGEDGEDLVSKKMKDIELVQDVDIEQDDEEDDSDEDEGDSRRRTRYAPTTTTTVATVEVARCESCDVCDSTTGQCKLCQQGMYRIESGFCVPECPPGWIETVVDANAATVNRTCTVCRGQVRRRHAAQSASATRTCEYCPKGFVPQIDVDECRNIQDACTMEQCQACLSCLAPLRNDVQWCVDKEETKAKEKGLPFNNSCYNPGTTWCGPLSQRFHDCASLSHACYYKILCSTGDICPEWKEEFCGGKTGNYLVQRAVISADGSIAGDDVDNTFELMSRTMARRVAKHGSSSENLMQSFENHALDNSLAAKCIE